MDETSPGEHRWLRFQELVDVKKYHRLDLYPRRAGFAVALRISSNIYSQLQDDTVGGRYQALYRSAGTQESWIFPGLEMGYSCRFCINTRLLFRLEVSHERTNASACMALPNPRLIPVLLVPDNLLNAISKRHTSSFQSDSLYSMLENSSNIRDLREKVIKFGNMIAQLVDLRLISRSNVVR